MQFGKLCTDSRTKRESAVLGPEDSEVDLRLILMNSMRKKDRIIFQVFSTQGQSEFLVVSAARWDEYSRMRAGQEEKCQELSKVIERQRRKEEYEEHTVMWARRQEECQELGKVIKYTSERQVKLLAMMERKKSLLSEAPEALRNQNFQEIRELDEKISVKEMEL